MAPSCGLRIRFPWLLVHLIDSGLVSDAEEGRESSSHRSYGVVDLVVPSCYAGGLRRCLLTGWTPPLSVLVLWLLLWPVMFVQLRRRRGACEVKVTSDPCGSDGHLALSAFFFWGMTFCFQIAITGLFWLWPVTSQLLHQQCFAHSNGISEVHRWPRASLMAYRQLV